ncbi:transporter substrate-binding domain-containing protein [Vibrio algicola]|uniref:Transporter substrate-binding domain-containing protein n=1 Tax=Vibrio algicola TaxID=2662262 RepID=A0A5Q0TEB6_9VIBR|nr:transporter substrate-binding domain-containing protein [Vibrio algicola]
MKRLWIICLTTLLGLGLGGAQSAWASDTPNLDKINQRGTLKVGLSTFVPWAMRDDQGELVGFEVDVAKRLAQDSGWKVEFIPTSWDGIIPSLMAGKYDVVIGGLTITDERSKSVLFSVPYSHSGIQIAANLDTTKGFSKQDFNSRKIKFAARRGALGITILRENFPKAKILQFDDEAQAFQEVLNGNADAVIASTPKPEFEALKYPKKLYIPLQERLYTGNEGFAVRLGEQDKKAFFDKWIDARTQDGWLEQRYNYWFKSVDWQKQVSNTNQ